MVKVFLLLKSDINLNALSINKDEISEVKLFDMDELKTLLINRPEMFVEDKKYFFDVVEKIKEVCLNRK